MAWAGFCCNIPDIGPGYAGMTMQANAAIPPTNDRMPVLLEPEEHNLWLHGGIRDVIRSQFRAPVAAERMDRLITDDPWRGDARPPCSEQLGLLSTMLPNSINHFDAIVRCPGGKLPGRSPRNRISFPTCTSQIASGTARGRHPR